VVTRVNALLYGIKMLAVGSFLLSQSTRMTDGRTDGRTELRQLYRANMRCMRRAVKMKLLEIEGNAPHC